MPNMQDAKKTSVLKVDSQWTGTYVKKGGKWLCTSSHTTKETVTIDGQRMLDQVGGTLHEAGEVVRASHERFDGRDLLSCDVEQRLVTHDELVSFDRAIEVHFHGKTLHRALVDAAAVQVPAVSADSFAGARRRVGGSKKVPDFIAILWKDRDADARSDK